MIRAGSAGLPARLVLRAADYAPFRTDSAPQRTYACEFHLAGARKLLDTPPKWSNIAAGDRPFTPHRSHAFDHGRSAGAPLGVEAARITVMPTMTIRAYGDSVTLLAFVQEAVANLSSCALCVPAHGASITSPMSGLIT